MLTLTESQLALAALASPRAGEREAVEVLQRLVRGVPTAARAGVTTLVTVLIGVTSVSCQ